ncbi:MAG: GFA family protein [Caulobacterales bacterium]|nr:GFA family protein [Caulobacterales bacterium]
MIEGGCNCGAVRYRIEGPPLGVAACHCMRCRRQSGSAYSVNLLVSPAGMTVTGALSVFEDTDTTSGAPVYREFCGSCGSPIRSVLGANPAMVAVKVGTLDDPEPFAPGLHVFTRSKIGWVEIPAGVPQFDTTPG